jgi:hypothetical protein
MAEKLIAEAVSAGEPVDLLVLAFSVHDLRPGRQTAAFLSGITPGAPLAFAICDQGSAATFSGLRAAREYASSGSIQRALVLVVEQAALPYDCAAAVPAQHRGVAMLFGGRADQQARLTAVRQYPGVLPARVADVAAAQVRQLAQGQPGARLVLGNALGELWRDPQADRVQVMPGGQPSTAAWWGLADELAIGAGRPGSLVVADYDPGLGYLCLAAFDFGASPDACREMDSDRSAMIGPDRA